MLSSPKPTKYNFFVCFSWEFAITEFVIPEFDCNRTELPKLSGHRANAKEKKSHWVNSGLDIKVKFSFMKAFSRNMF
jgi:hypothetical protein